MLFSFCPAAVLKRSQRAASQAQVTRWSGRLGLELPPGGPRSTCRLRPAQAFHVTLVLVPTVLQHRLALRTRAQPVQEAGARGPRPCQRGHLHALRTPAPQATGPSDTGSHFGHMACRTRPTAPDRRFHRTRQGLCHGEACRRRVSWALSHPGLCSPALRRSWPHPDTQVLGRRREADRHRARARLPMRHVGTHRMKTIRSQWDPQVGGSICSEGPGFEI